MFLKEVPQKVSAFFLLNQSKASLNDSMLRSQEKDDEKLVSIESLRVSIDYIKSRIKILKRKVDKLYSIVCFVQIVFQFENIDSETN